MEIVVLGAGSLGSLLGGLLAREHAVTLVGRDPHVGAVRSSGLQVVGEVETHAQPAATTDGTALTAELALVTVKAFDVPAAADELATGQFRAVLPLSNGLGAERLLAERLDARVLSGTATYGAVLEEPGVVRCTGVGEVALGDRDGGVSELARSVGTAFETGGIRTTVAGDMPRRRWEKLAVNAGINGVTALARIQNGAVLEEPARRVARQATRETARVAHAAGVDLPEAGAVEALERVAEETAANTSSTLQDVEAGRRTEVDALNGAVADRGDDHDVPTPVNRTIADLLRSWERAHDLR